jgi:hypothetical protein
MSNDWADNMFPGDGLVLPTDIERDAADHLIAQWNVRWGEIHPLVLRVHPDTNGPTNRAYLRSQLRRWWAQTIRRFDAPEHPEALGLEQHCVEPGHWRIEGYEVIREYGRWFIRPIGTRQYHDSVRTLAKARDWIREQRHETS